MSEDQESSAEEQAAAMLADRKWPVTIELKSPVDYGSKCITELVFRRGRLGDLKGLPVGSMKDMKIDNLAQIAANMCGQPLKVIELLSDEDAAEVIEIALGFFARCLTGGRKR